MIWLNELKYREDDLVLPKKLLNKLFHGILFLKTSLTITFSDVETNNIFK